MSAATKGEHMIPVLNELHIDCGCIGNHEFDFGIDHCSEMLSSLNFPTLNTNILTPIHGDGGDEGDDHKSKDTKLESLEPLGKCVRSHIHRMTDDFTVGIIGISDEWCHTLPVKPEHGIVYLDPIQVTQQFVDNLRGEHAVDLMIVLTHSRLVTDKLLAANVQGIDVILGGLLTSLHSTLHFFKN